MTCPVPPVWGETRLALVAVEKKLIEIDGLVQDCSNSIANALELLQSCTMLPESFLHIDTQIQSEIPLNNNVQEIRRSSDKPSNWGRQPPGI